MNLESLVQKLKAAVRHANWDLITEYNFLPIPLAEPFEECSESDPRLISENNSSEWNQSYETGTNFFTNCRIKF